MEDGDCRAGECCHAYKFCTRDTPCPKQVPGKFYLALYQLQWFIYKEYNYLEYFLKIPSAIFTLKERAARKKDNNVDSPIVPWWAARPRRSAAKKV